MQGGEGGKEGGGGKGVCTYGGSLHLGLTNRKGEAKCLGGQVKL